MNIESRNLRDEASQVYLEQVLVFDEMERLRLARQVLCGIFAVSVGVFAAHAAPLNNWSCFPTARAFIPGSLLR
ncbi:TPA: hypothetical protein SMG11_000482 [Serratia marcescens]|uniref:hypothetical protein n=1 Tax=Serratia TaxID=613 RepID=UPI000574AB79|nr:MULTISPECIES: hypothetical protein [Serratia]ASM07731.1 hypothetical protein BVG91_12140 [Serratia marcescens]AWC72656.1 hypothetical protein AM368_21725 [Serratia marcescens]AWC77366.1 hypothetical protein AM371_21560 [Serratia marcescens]AWC90629.1 hypothetical protein AM370_17450 [Serratia marcescens]AWS57167.1 hypothetical protein AM369_02190 [Serratia marcescens]